MGNPYNYNGFMARMIEFRLSYISSIYANLFLHKHFKQPSLQSHLLQEGEFFVAEDPTNPVDILHLVPDDITNFIAEYSVYRETDLDTTYDNWLKMNIHFLRTKVLNAMFELIRHYVGQYTLQWKKLHTLDWFQILYLLRNIASHHDKYNQKVEYPTGNWLLEPYPEVAEWNGVRITENHYGHEVHYTDKHVLELLDHTLQFFAANEAQFNKELL